ncbi:hypothetical protein D9M72_185940 [compost metagenome]
MVTTTLVTVCGNSLRIAGMKKLPRIITSEPASAEPRMPATPCSTPTLMAAPTKAKLVPITHGMRIPTGPMPLHWMMVTMPEPSRAAFTSAMTWSGGSFRAPPMTSGTAMMPPRAASRCWSASKNVVSRGGRSSTLNSKGAIHVSCCLAGYVSGLSCSSGAGGGAAPGPVVARCRTGGEDRLQRAWPGSGSRPQPGSKNSRDKHSVIQKLHTICISSLAREDRDRGSAPRRRGTDPGPATRRRTPCPDADG